MRSQGTGNVPTRPVSPEKQSGDTAGIKQGSQSAVVNGQRKALPDPSFEEVSAKSAGKKGASTGGTSGGSKKGNAARRQAAPVRPEKPKH